MFNYITTHYYAALYFAMLTFLYCKKLLVYYIITYTLNEHITQSSKNTVPVLRVTALQHTLLYYNGQYSVVLHPEDETFKASCQHQC